MRGEKNFRRAYICAYIPLSGSRIQQLREAVNGGVCLAWDTLAVQVCQCTATGICKVARHNHPTACVFRDCYVLPVRQQPEQMYQTTLRTEPSDACHARFAFEQGTELIGLGVRGYPLGIEQTLV